MNLVFQAEGLSVGEGAFLMACCNHTDNRGYVIAHMQQLADEAHMKERTARENKQRLIKRGLLKTAERYSPKNGARLADLYRVNVDLLQQMQRERVDYGPSLIEEITFDSPDETAGQTPPADSAAPPADSAAPPADSAGTPPADSAPLLLPSSSPSSLSQPPDAPAVTGEPRERESAAPKNSAADAVVDAYEAAAGRRMLNGSRARLRAQAVELLAAGRPVEWLRERAAEMPANGWVDLLKHCERTRVPMVPGQAGEPGPDGHRRATPEQVAALRARIAARGTGL